MTKKYRIVKSDEKGNNVYSDWMDWDGTFINDACNLVTDDGITMFLPGTSFPALDYVENEEIEENKDA